MEKSNTKDGTNTAVKITYDSLGNVTQKIDASGTTCFEHDPLGRITAINYGNGIRQNYTYNSADQVTAFELYQGGSKEIDLAYQYDNVGRLTTVRNSGKPFDYKYDAAGKLIEEMDGVTGIKSTYSYYPSGSLRSLRHFRGQELIDFYDYKYDKRGNQTEVAEQKGVTSYYYDSLSRIKTVLSPDDAIQNYEYDDLNNIKELVEIRGNNITETKYTYDQNSRLLLQETDNGSEVTQKRFTYDMAGNQTTKDEVIKRNGGLVAATHLDYYYDGANQLSRVTNDEGMFVEYTYNAEGLRTRKNFGDEATNFIYNNGYIVLETDQDNRITAKNIWGSQLIARETETDEYHYLYNGHGDVASLLNEKGETVKDYRYDVYGNAEVDPVLAFNGQLNVEQWRQETEKIDNPFRYCGEYLDQETGNYYLRARYYDPSIQRFINEDSYGVERGAAWQEHLYGYANNNPLRYVDPSGHLAIGLRDVVKALGGSIKWNNSTKKATVTIGKKTRTFSGKIRNGRLYVDEDNFFSSYRPKYNYQVKRAKEIIKATGTPNLDGSRIGGDKPKWISDGAWRNAQNQVFNEAEGQWGIRSNINAKFQMLAMAESMSGGPKGTGPTAKSLEDIFKNPQTLKNMKPEEVISIAKRNGWRVDPLGKGSLKGVPYSKGGISIRKIGPKGEPTDSYIQWHPGGGHHGDGAYWKVSSGKLGTVRIFD